MAFYDQMVAALNALLREDAIPYMAKADKLTLKNSLMGLAPLVSDSGVVSEAFAGAGIGATHDVTFDISSVTLMLNVTAGGVVTAVFDPAAYSFSGKTITWAADQTGDTMVCFYVPVKSWA